MPVSAAASLASTSRTAASVVHCSTKKLMTNHPQPPPPHPPINKPYNVYSADPKPPFNRKTYQRDYMRKRRQRQKDAKAKTPRVDGT